MRERQHLAMATTCPEGEAWAASRNWNHGTHFLWDPRAAPTFHSPSTPRHRAQCRTCQPPRSTLVLYSGRGRVRNCRNKARSTFHDRGCGGNGGVIYLALWAYVGSRLGLHCVCIRVWASSSRTAYSGYCSLVLARHDTNVRQLAVTPALRRLADCGALFARCGLYRSLRFPVLTRTALESTRIHKNLEHPTVSPFSLFEHISRTFFNEGVHSVPGVARRLWSVVHGQWTGGNTSSDMANYSYFEGAQRVPRTHDGTERRLNEPGCKFGTIEHSGPHLRAFRFLS